MHSNQHLFVQYMVTLEKLSLSSCSLSDIIQEIAKEDEEKERRHIRKLVAKQERLKARPPRLGKHKYDVLEC